MTTAITKYRDQERRDLPSASYMELISACPGFWNLFHRVEHRLETKDMARGTRIHEGNETGDVSDLVEEEADIVQRIRSAEHRIYTEWCDEFDLKDPEFGATIPLVVREKRLWITLGCHDNICSAKLDFMAEDGSHALILDAKSGRKEVTPSPRNLQLLTAAVAVFENYNVDHVRVGIVQPMAKEQPLCDYTRADLEKAAKKLEEILRATAPLDAPRVHGPHCATCPAAALCPEGRGMVTGLAALEGLRWGAIPADTKLMLFEQIKSAEGIIKQIKEHLKRDAAEGLIPGLQIKPGAIQREVSDLTGVFSQLLSDFGEVMATDVIQEEFTKACSIGIGDLKALVATIGGMKLTEADKWIEQNCSQFMTKKQKAGSLERVK